MRIAIRAVQASVLSTLLLGAALPLTAQASSLTVIDKPGAPAPASADVAPASPESCAERFHADFAAIRGGPFAALAAAAKSANAETDGAMAGEPRRVLYEPARAGGSPAEDAALRNARRWMAMQGAAGATLDRNGRWIAARIREDLGDYLGQGPSPFLCWGVANYLASLERYAGQIRVSPERRERDVETQRLAAQGALAAAAASLRPLPLPRFAPGDRPGTGLVAEELRESPVSEPAEVMGPPMRVAARADEDTQLSEGRSDPDLPPLRVAVLQEESDLVGAIDRLAAAMVAAEPLRPTQTQVSETDGITTGSIAAPAVADPVRHRLAALVPAVAVLLDPRTREAVTQALASIEALDALRHAQEGGETPFVTALDATFAAIRDAHREACRCTPAPAAGAD
mgnify:CR=1 FL=1